MAAVAGHTYSVSSETAEDSVRTQSISLTNLSRSHQSHSLDKVDQRVGDRKMLLNCGKELLLQDGNIKHNCSGSWTSHSTGNVAP